MVRSVGVTRTTAVVVLLPLYSGYAGRQVLQSVDHGQNGNPTCNHERSETSCDGVERARRYETIWLIMPARRRDRRDSLRRVRQRQDYS